MLPTYSKQVIVDPLALGDAAKRRRIYILVIHHSILRQDIDSNDKLESVLQKTINTMKTVGPPPDPFPGIHN